jgi:putative PEP-CTERM system histidine kinase
MTSDLGQFGYIAALAGCLVLALIYVLRGRWGAQGRAFLLAVLLTAAWAAAGWAPFWPHLAYLLTDLLHHASALAWILFMWLLVALSPELRNNYPRRIRVGWALIIGMTLLVLGFDFLHVLDLATPSISTQATLGLLISVAGLSVIETVFRSFRRDDRWGVKYLCLATFGIFAYDVFFFANAMLYRSFDETLNSARGLVLLILIPFFVVNIVRAESRHLALGLSSRMVFGSTVIMGTGAYLGLMAIGAFYIRDYGGTWSHAIQVLFIFGAMLLLCVALLSGTLRSYIRGFIFEHLQRQKFDYRHEWRKLLLRISASDSEEPLDLRVLKSLGDLVDSPAGALWYREGNSFALANTWNVATASIPGSDAESLINLFGDRDSVVDLAQVSQNAQDRDRPALTAIFRDIEKSRFLLPLFHHDELMGLVVLTEPRVPRSLDREDVELLTMASRQAAGYLSEQRSTRNLAETQEFERFNRRYAFVTHDIKNLVSQLTLMVRNFEKYGDRPDFQKDMIATIQSAAARMNHLMDRLEGDSEPNNSDLVVVKPLIERLIGEQSLGETTVSFDCGADANELQVRADDRRMDAILRHLLQNAVESSGANGKIVIGLRRERNAAVIEVRDSGKGMDQDFIRNDLFRPFRSTKRGGMGIGAFQCRTYARELGGEVEAISSAGAGTTMRVTLPLLHGS